MASKIRIDEVAVVENNEIVFRQKEFTMAPENSVAGSGKFVRTDAAEKMINEYINVNEMLHAVLITARTIINDNQSLLITSTGQISSVLQNLDEAIDIFSPDNDVVSGTYGKELLQNLLAREGCEGLRYTCCRYEKKNSIVFTPVDKEGENKQDQKYFMNAATIDETDPKGEIKTKATTRSELKSKQKRGMDIMNVTDNNPTSWGKRLLNSRD
jgi:hypothetical protein